VIPATPAPLPDVRSALQWARQTMERAGLAEEFSPANFLLARALSQPIAFVLAHNDLAIPAPTAQVFESWILRLANGEPLPYITGEQEFFGLPIEVTPETLIPRPETELLVERAIEIVSASGRALHAADVGTGSGCIAIAIAFRCPKVRVAATDISSAALAVARRNAQRYGLADRITAVQADLLSEVPGPLDLVCANLPYIPTETLRALPVARFEPWSALDGGPDGLRVIERLLEQCVSRIAPRGTLLLELEASQGISAAKLAARFFPRASIRIHCDYAGQERLLEIDCCPGIDASLAFASDPGFRPEED
jgi:release factor glutamine methyltransferase